MLRLRFRKRERGRIGLDLERHVGLRTTDRFSDIDLVHWHLERHDHFIRIQLDGELKYDLEGPDIGGSSCADPCDERLSYLWAANHQEGTVSKINTTTLVEEGRYITRPDGNGDPSRTSVAVDARSVVVANRSGGLVKIWTREEDCADTNGTPGIQTSTGKGDVLAWGEEECVAWFSEFPGTTVQRPVAWTSANCPEDRKIWTVTGTGPDGYAGACGPDTATTVHLVDGETGDYEFSLEFPLVDVTCNLHAKNAYGGAVDPDNNFWFHGALNNYLVRVDFETKDYEVFDDPNGSYGIAVDSNGRVWANDAIGGELAVFDYGTKAWSTINYAWGIDGGVSGGLNQDMQGRMWVNWVGWGANSQGYAAWVDTDTMMVGQTFPLSNQVLGRGIGVDRDGFVWMVNDSNASKFDPDTQQVQTYGGLTNSYTYSDLTGGALQGLNCTPEG